MSHTNDYQARAITAEAKLAQCEEKLAKAEKMVMTCNIEWAEDDTAIKALAKPFGIDVDGDSYGVPSMVDVVEQMAARLAKAEQQLAEANERHRYACAEKDKHGKYWHDLAQERIVAQRAAESALASAEADRKRMDLLERIVRWNDSTNTAKILFEIPTVPHCSLRAAIDATMTAEPSAQPSPSSTSNGGRG